MEYYRSQPWLGGPYQKCYATWGYIGNPTPTWHTDTVIDEDIWNWNCNWGVGVYVDISIDVWQRFWWGDGWLGSAWRPATHHCHCP